MLSNGTNSRRLRNRRANQPHHCQVSRLKRVLLCRSNLSLTLRLHWLQLSRFRPSLNRMPQRRSLQLRQQDRVRRRVDASYLLFLCRALVHPRAPRPPRQTSMQTERPRRARLHSRVKANRVKQPPMLRCTRPHRWLPPRSPPPWQSYHLRQVNHHSRKGVMGWITSRSESTR